MEEKKKLTEHGFNLLSSGVLHNESSKSEFLVSIFIKEIFFQNL